MRGTKQANEATAKKLERELGQFLENPHSHLPAMEFGGKLRWGRTDPVTKTLAEIEKIIKKKNDLKWLSKRMMAKRGDDVAKAFAGSLHAAHDEQFNMVGQFNSGSFGSGSYVRRGDGKPGYLAGIQNYANLTLRMLPWEEHARRGMYFFSWEGGFVCTGPKPEPPTDWLENVLSRSRFDLSMTEIDGQKVWTTEGLDAKQLVEGGLRQTVTLRSGSTQEPWSAWAWTPWRRSRKRTLRSSITSPCPCSHPSSRPFCRWTPSGRLEDGRPTGPFPKRALRGLAKLSTPGRA